MKNNGLLDQINTSLTSIEKEAIAKYVAGDEDPQKIENLLNNLDNNYLEPMSKPILQSNQTDSQAYNQQFRDFYADLFALYRQAQRIDMVIEDECQLNDSMIQTLKSGLKKIENKLKAYQFIVNNKNGFSEIWREPFNNKNNFVSFTRRNSAFYRDPREEVNYNEELLCDFDKTGSSLTLHRLGKIEPQNPRARIEVQLGEGFISNPNKKYPISNILNRRLDSIWSEVILSDRPFKVKIEEPAFYDETINAYIDSGALCKIQITFSTAMPLNTITINPFGDYPFKVLSIHAFESTEAMIEAKETGIVKKSQKILSSDPDIYLSPQYIEKPITFEFDVKTAKIVEIAINQEHYKLTQYILNEYEKNSIEIMNELFAQPQPLLSFNDKSQLNSVQELDNANNNKLWLLFNKISNKVLKNINAGNKGNIIDIMVNALTNVIPGLDKKSFNSVLTEKTNESNNNTRLIKVNKYEYQYGMKELDLSYIEYANKSMYVSELHQFNGNTKEVALIANDYAPEGTSIEYYVSNLKNPTDYDWYPILPEGYSRNIKGERIFAYKVLGDNIGFYAKLRFNAEDGTIKVFKNGQEINNDNISYIFDEQINEYVVYVQNHGWQSNSNDIYTVDYTVASNINPFIVDFNQVCSPREYINENGIKGETFENGTGHNKMIQLSYFPYIDYNEIRNVNNTVQLKTEISELYPGKYNENPLIGHYSPNYHDIATDRGYIPLEIEGEGQFKFFNGEKATVVKHIKQDTDGIPYRYYYVDDMYNSHEVIRDEYDAPRFMNVTDYTNRIYPTLNKYNAQDYPVFEYLQIGKSIFFNDTFNKYGSENQGKITVYYKYLVEGIRLKVIMRRNVNDNNGLTPILYDYAIKSRTFQF